MRPKAGAAIQGAINAALEGLTRGLALEFAPLRMNCVSPGLIMTEMYESLAGDELSVVKQNPDQRPRVANIGDLNVGDLRSPQP